MKNDSAGRYQLMQWYCELHHEGPLTAKSMVQLSGLEVVEALWPLNDLFRPELPKIRAMAYDERFGVEADLAIALLAEGWPPNWSEISAQAWRVLLERHMQGITVALANEAAGHRLLAVPRSFRLDQRTVLAALFLLHSMKLPFPVEDRSGFELPEGSLPVSFRQH